MSVVNAEQVATVESLGKVIWKQHYTPIIGVDQVDYMLNKFQSVSAINDQIFQGDEYYLILNEEDPIGYISLQKREQSLFLSKFYIHKEARGKGYGKLSLDFIHNRAKELGCKSIDLTVNKYNTNSIEAYKRMGFDITEEVVFDIGNGFIMDDYKMKKLL